MSARARGAGFTLLELLVTLSIVAGVVAVVLACFEGGFRVYARIRDFGTHEAEIYLAGEVLSRDLAHLIPGADYQFGPRELQFSRGPIGVGRAQGLLVRALPSGGLSQWDAPVGEAAEGGVARMLIPDDLDVTFSYASADRTDVWVPTWESRTNLPSAVRMQIQGERLDRDPIVRTMVLVVGEQREGLEP